MAVYVLHFEPAYCHARHYIGFTVDKDVDRRLNEHLTGHGSPLIKAAVEAGCEITVAVFWKTGTRDFERWIKNRGGACRWCPKCQIRTRPRPTLRRWRDRGKKVRRHENSCVQSHPKV